eukprot:1021937-Pyramimonas_sp.AAC.1
MPNTARTREQLLAKLREKSKVIAQLRQLLDNGKKKLETAKNKIVYLKTGMGCPSRKWKKIEPGSIIQAIRKGVVKGQICRYP